MSKSSKRSRVGGWWASGAGVLRQGPYETAQLALESLRLDPSVNHSSAPHLVAVGSVWPRDGKVWFESAGSGLRG